MRDPYAEVASTDRTRPTAAGSQAALLRRVAQYRVPAKRAITDAGEPMHAHTARQEALETTKRQPNNAPLDEIFYRELVAARPRPQSPLPC